MTGKFNAPVIREGGARGPAPHLAPAARLATQTAPTQAAECSAQPYAALGRRGSKAGAHATLLPTVEHPGAARPFM